MDETGMARLIPENVFSTIVTEAVQAQSQHTTEANANIAHVNNIARVVSVGGISTLDPVTARSVDKVLDQPN